VSRDCLRVRLSYEYTEEGNDYGDTVAKITGVYCPLTIRESVIFTRTTDYKIVPKRKPSPVENLTLEGRAAALGVLSITVRGAPDRTKNHRQKRRCQLIKPRQTTVQ
jgi:hypothetical protein